MQEKIRDEGKNGPRRRNRKLTKVNRPGKQKYIKKTRLARGKYILHEIKKKKLKEHTKKYI